jgi:hypothetical protein
VVEGVVTRAWGTRAANEKPLQHVQGLRLLASRWQFVAPDWLSQPPGRTFSNVQDRQTGTGDRMTHGYRLAYLLSFPVCQIATVPSVHPHRYLK